MKLPLLVSHQLVGLRNFPKPYLAPQAAKAVELSSGKGAVIAFMLASVSQHFTESINSFLAFSFQNLG